MSEAAASHKMALAAAAALEVREAEASKLKLRAQRLLRERSELAMDLEGLQETLGRMERAIAKKNEEAEALKAEGLKYTSGDTRRHSAQLQSLSKAVLREKQRRLSARNELGTLQRTLAKKRPHFEELAGKRAALEKEVEEAAAQ